MDTSGLSQEGSSKPEAPAERPPENLWLLDFLMKKGRSDTNPFEPVEEIEIAIPKNRDEDRE